MIPLLEHLPEAVEVCGREYPVYTDFRDWIAFEMLLLDAEYDDGCRCAEMLGWYREAVPADIDAALAALVWFYLGGKPPEKGGGSGAGKAIYDFAQDMELIFASFLDAYRIDLERVRRLHWWKFRALLLYIPHGTRLASVMGYRAADDSELSESQRRLKRLYDLGRRGQSAQQTLAERDRGMIEHARQARQRAEMARLSAVQENGENQ